MRHLAIYLPHRPLPPRPTPFPYTTLFRSRSQRATENGLDLPCRRTDDRHLRQRTGRVHHGFTEVPIVSAAAGEIKRSEEHTSELQSLRHLVCRLLLEKKKQKTC